MVVVYATGDLVDVLIDLARERDPQSVTVPLAVTPAGDLGETTLSAETPVFTHYYLPDVAGSVTAVFGIDLGTPAGQTPGLFISHPAGHLEVDETDDLREVIIVAIPPWDRPSIAAFDRSGRRLPLDIVEVEVPEESIP